MKLLNILLVEDNSDDAELIIRGLQKNWADILIHHVSDGEAALDYLFRRGKYAGAEKSPRPHLVLLDLRLPGIDGLDVLREIKADQELQRIPVVVLTSSEAQNDIDRACDHYVDGYLVKPMEFHTFRRIMQDLGL